jgi:hypothetical protein
MYLPFKVMSMYVGYMYSSFGFHTLNLVAITNLADIAALCICVRTAFSALTALPVIATTI